MTELPTTFGKYFLTEKLATGGMAEIYLAKLLGPSGFEKSLVIKQIHPKLSGQRHFVDLFVAEAKTLVTLAHGNIVPVYELGVVGATYFIAMDYIDGPTLYRLTEVLAGKDGRMDPNLAAWIAARILDGLDYAHRKGDGVIHRDLSPRNVMLSRDGDVKLVDFGIAVTLGEGDAESGQSAPTGSFPYMSPEQVRREPLTGQTDLFSVGVLLWEMLVGERLFARPEADATLEAVTELPIPRPSSKRPEIPAKLDDVVMRALERDRTKRWASAGEMLDALNRYLYSSDHTPGPRDLAALVARYCPPETRRLTTHAEASLEVHARAASQADDGTPPPAPGGPQTAVIPRDGAARGKSVRQQSFATHVELKDMLERATPMFGVEAISEELLGDDGPTTTVADSPNARPSSAPNDSAADLDHGPTTAITREPHVGRAATEKARAVDDPDAIIHRNGPQMPHLGRSPPSQAALMILAFGGLILAGLAVYVFMRGRHNVMRPDAAPKYDAPFWRSDADLRTNLVEPGDGGDASGLSSAPSDAAVSIDASTPPRDASNPPRDAAMINAPRDAITTAPQHDAHPVATPDASVAVKPAGKGTLKIGAEPWGEVILDGTKLGKTTPIDIEVSAGHHVVEIVYSGVEPALTRRFTVDLGDGESKPLHADFQK